MLTGTALRAEPPAALVKQGNAAYEQGNYDEALALYEKASVELPESAPIYFNQGDAYYRKGEYAKARDAYEKAALNAKDITLEAKSRYNLGNLSFLEVERQRDSDLEKAVDACRVSIQHYQDALKLDPQLEQAATNIEIVRLTMKVMMDELKKRQEEAEKQKKEQQKTLEQLEKLIKEQEQAVQQNETLAKAKAEQGDSSELQDKVQNLADTQKNIRDETRQFTDNLAQAGQPPGQPPQPPPQQPGASPLDAARKHLENAVDEQNAAGRALDGKDLAGARPAQVKATEALKKARDTLAGDQQQQPQPQQQQDQQQDQQKDQQQDRQQGQDGQQDQQPEQQTANVNEEAHDILDEEKENREQRGMQVPAGDRPVDKDW
ncbi:MAG: tetratricopeptide repeat protein [Kiritimatiellae bacterium]|nr:tetratricopeptide repeat protein [Kiritimatiellia bacterium]